MPVSAKRWKSYNPTDSRRAKTIDSQTWETFRREITLLHSVGGSKQAILDVLSKDSKAIDAHFKPTMNQLIRQMSIWNLRDDQRRFKKQNRNPSATAEERSLAANDPVTEGLWYPFSTRSPPPFPPPPVPFTEPRFSSFTIGNSTITEPVAALFDMPPPPRPHTAAPILSQTTSSPWDICGGNEPLLPRTEQAQPELESIAEVDEDQFVNCRKKRPADSNMDELESSLDAMTIESRSSPRFSKVTGMPSNRSSSVPPSQSSRRWNTNRDSRSNEIYNFARRSVAFYEVGRVFGHLLIDRTNGTDVQFEGRITLANGFHSRDFIVTRRSGNYFVAVPFHRHRTVTQNQGVSRIPENGQEHLAIIHLEDEEPVTLHEAPVTTLKPIAVRPVQATRSVLQPSVINFSKRIKFHYSGLVMDLGMVTEESMPHFEEYTKQEIGGAEPAHSHSIDTEIQETRSFWKKYLPVGVENRTQFEIDDETCSKAKRLMASQSQITEATLPTADDVMSVWSAAGGEGIAGCFSAPIPATTMSPLPCIYSPCYYPPPSVPIPQDGLNGYYIPASEFV